jgi:hypothetical protein
MLHVSGEPPSRSEKELLSECTEAAPCLFNLKTVRLLCFLKPAKDAQNASFITARTPVSTSTWLRRM